MRIYILIFLPFFTHPVRSDKDEIKSLKEELYEELNKEDSLKSQLSKVDLTILYVNIIGNIYRLNIENDGKNNANNEPVNLNDFEAKKTKVLNLLESEKVRLNRQIAESIKRKKLIKLRLKNVSLEYFKIRMIIGALIWAVGYFIVTVSFLFTSSESDQGDFEFKVYKALVGLVGGFFLEVVKEFFSICNRVRSSQ